uniref:Wolframin n=1 Tax=Timema genevievae TaxID=629358 RepID=A0A7R9JVI4_TIMGE|nr:unnamed protein product [Timema genevievae]
MEQEGGVEHEGSAFWISCPHHFPLFWELGTSRMCCGISGDPRETGLTNATLCIFLEDVLEKLVMTLYRTRSEGIRRRPPEGHYTGELKDMVEVYLNVVYLMILHDDLRPGPSILVTLPFRQSDPIRALQRESCHVTPVRRRLEIFLPVAVMNRFPSPWFDPQRFQTVSVKQWVCNRVKLSLVRTNGPRGSLRRLRSQLAEDGCPESQVVLAKQLLEETCELEVEREENSRLGVYWLIKSSEQGNMEATTVLKQCLESGQGITEHNYVDVNRCLNMSQDEKLARRAAREMFSRNFVVIKGHQKVTNFCLPNSVDSLLIQLFYFIIDSVKFVLFPDWTLRSESAGEKLTEDHLVSAAVNYARGELPLVHRVLTLSNSCRRDVQEINYIHRILLHPINTLQILYYELIETIAKRGASFVSSLFPIVLSHVQTIVLLFVYSILGTESILLFVPMFFYYVSFCAMAVFTFQMLHRKTEFQDFRVWSRLFLRYSGGNLNPEEAEYQYCSNNLRPYGQFFLALLVNLMIYPLIAPQWTPQSEFAILAFFLTFLTLYVFMDNKWPPDWLALFSFALHVLAKYPYETDVVVRQGWRFLDIRVPTFASYVVGNGVEFCLNCRAVFYLLIPAIFLRIAARDSWRGTYKTLIPHCVTLAWWQVAVISSQGATWYGLIRGALALVGLVLFLPLAGLAAVLLPVAAAGKYLADSAMMVRAFITTLLASVIFGVVAAVFLIHPLLYDGQDSTSMESVGSLSWEQYQNHCHQPAWEQSSLAAVQLRCAHLADVSVSWDGYVTDIRVRNIHNVLDTVLSKFPVPVRDTLACWYGDKYDGDCRRQDTNYGSCKMMRELKLRRAACHLHAWDRYEFEIVVKMKSGMWGTGALVSLVADDSFRNFTTALRTGDRVWFTGLLMNGMTADSLLGGPSPQVDLEEIGCLGCHTSELQIHKKPVVGAGNGTLLGYLYTGIKSVLNFVFNPLVIFR